MTDYKCHGTKLAEQQGSIQTALIKITFKRTISRLRQLTEDINSKTIFKMAAVAMHCNLKAAQHRAVVLR